MVSKDGKIKTNPASTRSTGMRGSTKGERRVAQRQRAQRRRTIRNVALGSLISVAVAGLIFGVVGVNAIFPPPTNELPGINEGGPVPIQPDEGGIHIGPGAGQLVHPIAHAPYGQVPATSGPHYFTGDVLLPNGERVTAPAVWDTYNFALPDEVLVHNLEHGGIGLHYDCPSGCDAVVEALSEFIPSHHSQFILSPYPGLVEATESRIAVTSWRHSIHMNEVDAERIEEFIAEYQNRAPESIPGNQFSHPR